jgi:drug/metabolite transporter (DMT)-like permease
MPRSPRSRATVLGVVAIVLWSSSVAFIRTVSEELGPFSTVAFAYLLAGAASLAATASTEGGLRPLLRLPARYLWGCGALFVAYSACYCLAVGLAADREQVLEVALVNYLWPSLTLLLALPLQGHRARWFLAPGMLAASAGVVLATAQRGDLSLVGLWDNAATHAWPYGLALLGAVAWALYSNLARRWGGRTGGVPLFLVASGLVVLPLRFVFGESSTWGPRVVGELVYMAVFVTFLAYVFWDHAMRRGNIVLVAALSYFTPLLSTFFSAAYLGVVPGPTIWLACVLVIGGALTCRAAVIEDGTIRAAPGGAPDPGARR